MERTVVESVELSNKESGSSSEGSAYADEEVIDGEVFYTAASRVAPMLGGGDEAAESVVATPLRGILKASLPRWNVDEPSLRGWGKSVDVEGTLFADWWAA
ncbi:uncharacterized protein IUM83_12766 [Phytophthora cinnamomi]|uniref:uncharacterized protein n=1 Tax=Phytophthora cinnamomi TaxID=4785 RepID=UPI0035598C7A|nr:hypothetical protein IUM83_12766 [Phytophthora cinnamomi]